MHDHAGPEGRAAEKKYAAFGKMTAYLLVLSNWFDEQGATHVAMESSGVYWKPLFKLLKTASHWCWRVARATRFRTTLVGERARAVNRIEKTLQGAKIKLGDVASDVLGT